MEITKIMVDSITPKDYGICGDFSIVFDDSLCIHHIRVVQGRNGLFVSFPNLGKVRLDDGTSRYIDIVHPTKNSLREYISNEVLTAYDAEISKSGRKNKKA